MSVELSGILGSILKLIDYLGERPAAKEATQITIYILSIVFLFVQAVIPILIPEQAIARRLALILITYIFALAAALVIGKYIRLRRWLIYLSPLMVAPILIGVIYLYTFFTGVPHRLAPDFLNLGNPLPYTTTYCTNARVIETQSYKRNLPTGPEQFVRLKFQLFCTGVDENCNAGWMIGNLQGVNDLNSVQELVFEVRGAEGKEVIGVTMKDKTFTESRIFDISDYVSGGSGISSEWKTARIPLTKFNPIDLTRLNLISFFADARYYPFAVIDFDIANIRLE